MSKSHTTDKHEILSTFSNEYLYECFLKYSEMSLWEYFLTYLYSLSEYFQDKVHVTHTYPNNCIYYSKFFGLVHPQLVSARFIDASRYLSRDSYRDTVRKYRDTKKKKKKKKKL